MSRLFTTNSTNVITVSPAASINTLAARTIMCWFKSSNFGIIGDSSLFTRGANTWFDAVDPIAFPNEPCYSTIATGAVSAVNAGNLSLNTWVHLALTCNFGGDKKTHLYINGVEVASYASQIAGSAAEDDSAIDLTIGHYPGFDGATGDNKFFDFRIYNSILTPANLAAIINTGPTNDPDPGHMVCQLTFALNQGSPEPDASGNSNTGAITGATFSADNPSFVPPPTVLSINPAGANQGVTNKRVIVIGTDFDSATAVLTFSGAGVTVAGYESKSATQIIAFVDITAAAGATARDVIVTNGDTQADTLAAAFTVVSYIPNDQSGISRLIRNPRVPRRGMV